LVVRGEAYETSRKEGDFREDAGDVLVSEMNQTFGKFLVGYFGMAMAVGAVTCLIAVPLLIYSADR
jgi:hypothetical protein